MVPTWDLVLLVFGGASVVYGLMLRERVVVTLLGAYAAMIVADRWGEAIYQMVTNQSGAVLNEQFDGSQHVILDGTCRRPDQSRAADDMMRLWGRDNLHVITLTLSPESAKARLIARGRVDDAKDEAIASRFAWYEEHVVPAMEELRTLGWAVHEIDGEPDVETIHKSILSALAI